MTKRDEIRAILNRKFLSNGVDPDERDVERAIDLIIDAAIEELTVDHCLQVAVHKDSVLHHRIECRCVECSLFGCSEERPCKYCQIGDD